MERAKEKGFTQPASIVVKPIENQGRNMYPLFSNSISYEREFVNSESWVFGGEKGKMSQKLREFFYIGDKYVFDSGDEYDKR